MTASFAVPSNSTSPPSMKSARSHSSTTAWAEWLTKSTDAPVERISSMRAKHLRWKASSPTASTSSTTRMSGSTWMAAAKARRAYMPLE